MKQNDNIQKVKLIHSVYLSHKNGANTVINLLLGSTEQFSKNGIDISYLAPEEGIYSEVNGGLKGKLRKRVSKVLKDSLSYFAKTNDWAVKKALQIKEERQGEIMARKYLSQNPPAEEVAFFHTFFSCYYYLKERHTKQHVVLVLHTNGESFKMARIYYPRLEKTSYYQELLEKEKYVLENVDRIVFVAQKPREIFLSQHPYVNPDKVFCVYNGVKNYTIQHKRAGKNGVIEVCCVASISNRKGQHFIVDALNNMNPKPKVHFTFVGDGADKVNLEKQVVAKGLQDYITFAGVTSDVDSFLGKSDIYILPSEDEGLPMAILEAMRASLPIVSTPVGGIPELLTNGYNGMMIRPSIEGVKEFLEQINQIDWKEMGENARRLFEERFTVEKMVDGYSKILTF